MRGKVAKLIRKVVYGDEFSFRYRQYRRFIRTGAVIADDKRQLYQKFKKAHTNRTETITV